MSRPSPGAPGRGRPIGLGLHQGVEILLGVFLVLSSTRIGADVGSGAVLGLGVTLVVLPAITTGPLAAVRIISPAVHRALDVVVVVLAAASPFLHLGLDANSILLMALAALAVAALVRSTSYAVRRRPPKSVAAPPPTPAWARDLGTAAARARTELPRHAGRVIGRLKKGRP